MLFVILVVCATVCAEPWHTRWFMTKPKPYVKWYASTVSPSRPPPPDDEGEFFGRFSAPFQHPTNKEESRRPHSHEECRHHPHPEGDRHRRYPKEDRHRHSYGEEGRHLYHEEDRYHPYHEEDRYRQHAKKQICSGDFLKKYDGVGPYERYHKILSVTVQFEHGNRTVSCTNNGRYHHHHL
ncbi:hypothetical protein GCK32_006882 [Trichostrongylus colubriformis]|uniref:Uncharacterized protein n=1 Tax=Trichostrongylus colubriformis TaxID=6319 RepID=A0AAN8J299_TRICO